MPEAIQSNAQLLTLDELQSRLGEFYRGVTEFNDGYYFESHETLEDLWMVTPWPERDFIQAIIQVAAAFVHFVRGEFPGILKLLDAALAKLEAVPPDQFRVDVKKLIVDLRQTRNEFATLGPDRFTEFDERLVPKVRMKASRARPKKKPTAAGPTPM